MPDPRVQDMELAETFAEVARVLLENHDVDTTLTRICELAVKTVDGCEAAGISIAEGKEVTSRSTTDALPCIVDQIQSETQQGPCVDAIREHAVFITGSLSREERWPEFAKRAYDETGVQSILSLRLFAREDTMGALNLYSLQPHAFDERDVAVGSVFAAHAAVALATAKHDEQLENKSQSSDLIGMAKGIIIARQNVSEDEAFDILRRASQRMNVRLRELAARVVYPETADAPVQDAG